MAEESFASSDSVRGAGPLRHARSVRFDGPVVLEQGGQLPYVDVVYETYGRLDEAADNAILICHALSGDSHVACHDEADAPGWWNIAVGPGKAIDTDKFFVICPNILGGCRGTTGPNSTNPATGKPYGQEFPTVTIGDMVQVQRRLLDHLGVGKLLSVVGGSMGGHQVLYWVKNHSDQLMSAVAIATSPRLTSQALAFDVVGRDAIIGDPNFRDGQYYDGEDGPDVGLGLARMIGHITYLSRESMKDKFEADRHQPRDISTGFEKRFSVGSYLGYQADKFVERFDANSYITLTMAMDMFDIGGSVNELADAFKASTCRHLVISFTSDWLFPPDQSQEVVDALIATNNPVTYCSIASDCGHDAFLLPGDLASYGELIRAFLVNVVNVNGGDEACDGVEEDASSQRPTGIWRLDYDLIMDLIPEGVSVLDLGCGTGELLARLTRRGHEYTMGIELDEKAIISCVRRGLDVIQADLNKGLPSFADGQFDFVVLSQTLQAVMDVEGVVDDILRVGRRSIVSFPNFAYRKLRKMLAETGRAPESPGLLKYKWYNTPNIRCLSIADFEDFCLSKGVTIHRMIALDTEEGVEVHEDANLNADMAIFVISR